MVPEFADKVPARAEALKDGGELILCLCAVAVVSGNIDTTPMEGGVELEREGMSCG